MGLAKNIMQGGFSPGQASSLNGQINSSITATGTVITDAFDLVADVNIVTTAASGTGVQLPLSQPGDTLQVFNAGANSVKVYPPSSTAQINALTAGVGHLLSVNTACIYTCVSSTRWIANLSA